MESIPRAGPSWPRVPITGPRAGRCTERNRTQPHPPASAPWARRHPPALDAAVPGPCTVHRSVHREPPRPGRTAGGRPRRSGHAQGGPAPRPPRRDDRRARSRRRARARAPRRALGAPAGLPLPGHDLHQRRRRGRARDPGAAPAARRPAGEARRHGRARRLLRGRGDLGARRPDPPAVGRLVATATAALRQGLGAARAGRPISAIGSAVEAEVERRGCHVLRELTGHGIGRAIHERADRAQPPRSRLPARR